MKRRSGQSVRGRTRRGCLQRPGESGGTQRQSPPTSQEGQRSYAPPAGLSGGPEPAAQPREDERPELRRELLWLTTLRLVVVTTLLVSALLVQFVTGLFFRELNPIYYLVFATYLLSLIYLALFHKVRDWFRFGYVQLSGDLLIVTGLIYYSGGLDSAFTFLYILPILTGSILLAPRGGLIMASLASVGYGTLVALIYNQVIPSPEGFLGTPGSVPVNQVYYNLFVGWLAFYASALLATYVAEKLRRTGERLEQQSADLESMQIFYEDVINSVKSGLLTTDTALRILSLNRGGEVILGRSEGELKGLDLSELLRLSSDFGQAVARAGGEGLRFERIYETPGIGPRHLSLVASELHDREGTLRGMTFVFQDLTRVKELEHELRQSERLAALGQMAAGIAHEIRNPLASMSGSIQVLGGEVELESEQRRLMDIVLSESERLNRIVEDFLFYAKPSVPDRRPVDPRRLVDETVTLARNSDELKPGQRILVEVRPGMPETIEADAGHLRQVFWNLVRNSLNAMSEDGTLCVVLEPCPPDRCAVVFEDDGCGFEEKESRRLFEPFHGSSRGGSGLGLAIVYRIVKEHGGKVVIGTREPRGARVRVELPVRASDAEREAPAWLEESRT